MFWFFFKDATTQVNKGNVEFEKAPKQETYKPDKDDFKKMSFEVELNKTEFVLLEPIGIKFRFANKTNQPQTSFAPTFLTETTVKISRNDKNWDRSLYNLSISIPVRPPRLFMPGQTVESNGIVQPNFENKFFPEPGIYQLQFFLSADGIRKLPSAVFEVEIKRPTGIDKEAFDYLMKYQSQSSSELFYFDGRKNGNDAPRLEKFVAKYGSTAYGEYAIFSLGNFYLFYDEFEKAEVEFEKIKTSDNKIIADATAKALAEVEKCKAESKK